MQKLATMFGLEPGADEVKDRASTYEVLVSPVSPSRPEMRALAKQVKGCDIEFLGQRVTIGKRQWIGHLMLNVLRSIPTVRVVILQQVL